MLQSQLGYSWFSIPCYLVMSIERSHHTANSPPDIYTSHRNMYLYQSILVHLASCTRDNRWLAYTSCITPCYISRLTSIVSYTYYTESVVSHQTVPYGLLGTKRCPHSFQVLYWKAPKTFGTDKWERGGRDRIRQTEVNRNIWYNFATQSH